MDLIWISSRIKHPYDRGRPNRMFGVISKFSSVNRLIIDVVTTILDGSPHGWIGWDSNFGPTAALLAETAAGTLAGYDSVDGFICSLSATNANTRLAANQTGVYPCYLAQV